MLASGLGAVTGCSRPGKADDLYRWGSSSLGSSGYVIIEAFSQIATRHTPWRHASLATAGTSENMFLLGEGKLEFAHSTSVDWLPALSGSKPYTQPVRANQLFAYAIWHQLPIVNADSGIESFSDLAGRRFSASQPGSGSAAMFNLLLRSAGLYEQVQWRYGSWSEIYTAFRAGQIDSVVGMLTNRVRSKWIRQLDATMPIRALEIQPGILAQARGANPGILIERLEPGDWSAVERPMQVPAIAGIVAASADVTPEVGYEVTSSILSRSADLKSSGPALNLFDPDFAVRHLISAAPVNAGAAQYFIEQGLWRDDLTVAG